MRRMIYVCTIIIIPYIQNQKAGGYTSSIWFAKIDGQPFFYFVLFCFFFHNIVIYKFCQITIVFFI
ncbi:hypothetical protein HanHA300_Chr09g0330561 [Helianthus annuus]|nr:hypothetical protein HanHA300_Chr09g0330561 [Helianthus annuus]KAJ0543511.1 hypothetical protein HanHA89_Chr09g0351501 [Helianthus annuus]KAJ0708563.1 hypothetical protein HanLR1_Chr09g0330791 [Helianthus annuus]